MCEKPSAVTKKTKMRLESSILIGQLVFESFTVASRNGVGPNVVQYVTTHSVGGFAVRRRALLVVGVERRYTLCVFLCSLFLPPFFYFQLNVLVLAVVADLAPGCGEESRQIIPHF